MNWNAVWDVAVGEEKDAWVSEFKIPFSQLRFPKDIENRVWGLHSWRWHRAENMESNWQIIPRDNSGFVYQFGELRGLENLQPKRQIEIMPYLSGSLVDRPSEQGNPFRNGLEKNSDAGLDAKNRTHQQFHRGPDGEPGFWASGSGSVRAEPEYGGNFF